MVVLGGAAVSFERGNPVRSEFFWRLGPDLTRPSREGIQGYLAHKKPPPPRTLHQGSAYGPMVVLGGGAFSHERGTPVHGGCVGFDPYKTHFPLLCEYPIRLSFSSFLSSSSFS